MGEVDDIPEEDKFLKEGPKATVSCEHEYVDFYHACGYLDKEATKLFVWMFCKKCLNRRKLYFDMSEAVRDFEDEE